MWQVACEVCRRHGYESRREVEVTGSKSIYGTMGTSSDMIDVYVETYESYEYVNEIM